MEEAFKIAQKSSRQRNDCAVQGTNDSSVLSKISMCQIGYFDDDFLKHFASKSARRSPLVNRGYYIRMKLVEFIMKEFIEKFQTYKDEPSLVDNSSNEEIDTLPIANIRDRVPSQIISLGAGFDSTYFRLRKQGLLNNTLFIEIDFPDVVKRKVTMIKANDYLSNCCPDLEKASEANGNFVFRSKSTNYVIIGLDMRNTQLLSAFLKAIDCFSENIPTLLLSEVVLTYMAVNSGNAVLKWVAETFRNCVLAIYEQINPTDPFGQVMISHFKKLGSPLKSIAKYPSEFHQIKRHLEKGFKNCFSIKAVDYYLNNIPTEERKRINQLELFDEYEQWHLKCCHYSFVFATNGQICKNFVESLLAAHNIEGKNSKMNIDEMISKHEAADSELRIKVSEFPVKFGVRFGHSVCQLGDSNKIALVGGFGESVEDTSGKHKRLTSIEIVDLEKMSLTIVDPIESNLIGDRVFHTTSACSSNQNGSYDIFALFGRSNPSKVFDSIIKINLVESTTNSKPEFNVKMSQFPILNETGQVLERFRHGSCLFDNNTKLFFYAGKRSEGNLSSSIILNDAYVLDVNNGRLQQVELNEDLKVARHTHSICTWRNYILITGGLTETELVLNDIILIDWQKNFEIKKIQIKGQIHPRYSHTSHVIGDILVLVGGVNCNDNPPGVCLIDLVNLEAQEFNVPNQTSDGSPLMLVNHQAFLRDKNTIVIVGGGGICFTFGTHLNRQPILLDITDCWSIFESRK